MVFTKLKTINLMLALILFQLVAGINITPPTQEAQALGISFPTLQSVIWNINENGKTWTSPDFYFTLTNDAADRNIMVEPSAEILRVENWQEFITVTWNTNQVLLEPNESYNFISGCSNSCFFKSGSDRGRDYCKVGKSA